MSDQATDQKEQGSEVSTPRITPSDIEKNIAAEHYFLECNAPNALHHPAGGKLELMAMCVLVLRSGAAVTGKSASTSPEDFDAEFCRRIARQNAMSSAWPLVVHSLKGGITGGDE